MKYNIAFLLTFFFMQNVFAQELKCGFGSEMYSQFYDDWYQSTAQSINQNSNAKRGFELTDSVYKIKVVFHLLYRTGVGVNMEDVLKNLNQINLDFRRMNSDTIKMRSIYKNRVGDPRIEFVLADSTPDGQKSGGFTFKKRDVVFGNKLNVPFHYWHKMKFDSLGGTNAWDTRKYLNIWVCDLSASDYKKYVGGFATPPKNAPNWASQFYGDTFTDGVVIDMSYFLFNSRSSALTHEIGHYLGLRHVSGDPGVVVVGECKSDDYIDDTPKVQAQNNYCDNTLNTCIEFNDDLPDMIENYMDYTGDYCRNSFTLGQIALMRKCLVQLRPQLFTTHYQYEYKASKIVFSLYPNPSQNEFKIEFTDSFETGCYYELFDLSGRKIVADNLLEKVNILNTNQLSPSVYWIRIFNKRDELLFTDKLIKI